MRRGTLAAAGLRARRPIFQHAHWLYEPIKASPTLDASSATMVAALSAVGTQHVCGMVDFGVAMRGPAGVTLDTARYDIAFTNAIGGGGEDWGPDPFFIDMPLPDDITIPPGSDGHVVVADPALNLVFGLWQANYSGGASWGGIADLNGDGIDYVGSATGSMLSRYAAVITVKDILRGAIEHALFFSTDIARLTTFRYPAGKTDGANFAGNATTIPEGARVQLDPTINLAAISGITAGELMIGRALQRYGAYCGDNGGARMGFLFELADDADETTPGAAYVAAGLEWDYFDLTHIPWSSLRVLATWDGA